MPPPPKTEAATAATASKPEKPAPAPVAVPEASPAKPAAPAGFKAWLPAIISVVLAPAVTWATAEFVLLPRLQKKLNLPVVATAAVEANGTDAAKGGKTKESSRYEFQNVVVNLAGTMGTRYLKVGFVVIGDEKNGGDLKKVFEEKRTVLFDTTLNVLSSLTLADLEEAGAKNVIREKLVAAYNQALGKHIADQVYFSDFVVQ